jgi:hypothetical protein
MTVVTQASGKPLPSATNVSVVDTGISIYRSILPQYYSHPASVRQKQKKTMATTTTTVSMMTMVKKMTNTLHQNGVQTIELVG